MFVVLTATSDPVYDFEIVYLTTNIPRTIILPKAETRNPATPSFAAMLSLSQISCITLGSFKRLHSSNDVAQWQILLCYESRIPAFHKLAEWHERIASRSIGSFTTNYHSTQTTEKVSTDSMLWSPIPVDGCCHITRMTFSSHKLEDCEHVPSIHVFQHLQNRFLVEFQCSRLKRLWSRTSWWDQSDDLNPAQACLPT